MSKQSNKYLCYFIDCIYTLSQKDQYFSDIFFIFLGSLILNQSKNTAVSDGFKILTIKSFVENYKEWGRDDRFAFSEEQLLNMLLSIFQLNKDLMADDKGFAMELKSSGSSLQIIACILTGDMKATFVQYQRLVEENKMFTEKMFEWINMSFSNPKDRQNILQLLNEENQYLVGNAFFGSNSVDKGRPQAVLGRADEPDHRRADGLHPQVQASYQIEARDFQEHP